MIRKADDKDFDKIMRLWHKTNSAAHSFIDAGYWQKNADFVRYSCLPASQTFVFVDRHQIKGFISLLEGDYIGACFVDKLFQNKKIGGKLIRYLQKRYNLLRLHVYTLNDRAVSFYRRNGFKIIGETVQEETGCAELLMCWSLGCPPSRFARQKGDS